MNLAPIVLFVYNRPEHTRKTLEALSNNLLAKDSILYIFCDGPKENANEETLLKIKKTREVIRERQWCKEVIISESTKNIGCASSIIMGIKQIIDIHLSVIILEDDILTSPYFLTFMNEGLQQYKDNPQVKTVAAYIESIDINYTNAILLPVGSSWGWGIWKKEFDEINYDIVSLISQISKLSSTQIKNFNYAGENYFDMLKSQQDGKIDAWDIRFYASHFLQNGLHLRPSKSLTKNIGFDNEGTHCLNYHPIHSINELCLEKIFVPSNLKTIDHSINKKIINLYRKQRLIEKINYRKNQFIRVINRLRS